MVVGSRECFEFAHYSESLLAAFVGVWVKTEQVVQGDSEAFEPVTEEVMYPEDGCHDTFHTELLILINQILSVKFFFFYVEYVCMT